ncbi:LysR family transcriptional regulator [Roseovarius sp. EL26]|uniref:LysR family transcriptional regulator n=1 Tax=Roseovarius sp. EL26 TaxID=2126672 RepID=UPI000EA0DD7B|nr:LysR family transcriptional regulator [Roseovarius sp. EL26]
MTIASRLPPFSALRGFEAAARLNSFRLAAEELCLSTSAISHHIRHLEEFFGQPLFVRSPSGVTLTPCGREYLSNITPILCDLVTATDRAMKKTKHRTVTLRCSPGCASRWLVPRLNMLKRALGGIDINLTTQPSGPQPDVEIRCGYTFPPDTRHEVLLTTLRAPVCSAEYIRAHGPIENSSDLSGHTLLREHQLDEWDRWFAIATPGSPISEHSIWFDDGHGAILAAEQGMGICLGHLALIRAELASGQLVQLFDQTTPESIVYTLEMQLGWQNDDTLVTLRNCLVSDAHEMACVAE